MKTTVLQKPKGLPVSLQETKRFLKVIHTQEDDVILQLIEAATEMVEQHTRRKLMPQVLNAFMPFEPNHKKQKGLQRVWVCADRYALFLPHGPVSEVVSVERIEDDGQMQALGRYEFHINLHQDPPLIVIEKRRGFGVRVVYKVGYTDKIPPALKQALLTIVGRLYTDRTLSEGMILKNMAPLLAPFVMARGCL